MRNNFGITNEVITLNSSPLESTKKNLRINFILGSISICKIRADCYDGDFGCRDISSGTKKKIGSGFFIKFKKPNSDSKYKYFMMTCEHVIQKEIIKRDLIEFEMVYFYEKYSMNFSFNKSERFIKEYMTDFNIDVTLIEIKPNEIPVNLFLEPDYNIKNPKRYINDEIIIHQYPSGYDQCVSQGKILNINNRQIVHESSTEPGSSGSPIILKNKDDVMVIGIHKGGDKTTLLNYGNIIIDVIKDVEKIKNVDYILEENINRGFNFTAQEVSKLKTINSTKYNIYPYEILLKKINEKSTNLSITNVEGNISFVKILNENIGEASEKFDKHIYFLDYNENNDYIKISSFKGYDPFEHLLYKKKENNENYIIAKVFVEVPKRKKKLVQIINSFENCIRDKQYQESNRYINPNMPYSQIMDLTKKYENENEIKANCQISINSKNIPFCYQYEFDYSGTYTIKYIFNKKITKADFLFYNCQLLKYIDLSHFKTDKITNMESMFEGCTSLNHIDLTNIDTTKVTTMFNMFSKCQSLNNLDFSFVNTEKVTNMRNMFYQCKALSNLNLSYFATQNVTTMQSMFNGCNSLITLDLSSFETPKLENLSYMFYCCYSLKDLDLSKLSTKNAKDMTYLFNECNSIGSGKVITNDEGIKQALKSCQIF